MCLSSSVYFWLMSMWSYGFSLICSFVPSNGHLNSILLIARILWIGDYIELGLNRLIGYDIRKDEEEFMSTSQDFWILANSAMWQDVLYIKILSHTRFMFVLHSCISHGWKDPQSFKSFCFWNWSRTVISSRIFTFPVSESVNVESDQGVS